MTGALVCRAADAPRPPCAGEPEPAWPSIGRPPAVRVWDPAQGRDWTPPACLGWTAPGYSTLVTTSGRFRNPGGIEILRARLGAVSTLAGLEYWSTSRQGWHTLIAAAAALAGPDGPRRTDFAPADLAAGRTLWFEQEDNIFGKGVYSLRIRAAAADRLEFEIANAGVIRLMMLPVFQPGDMQAVYWLARESGGVWSYYAMARTLGAAGGLAAGHEASSINRAAAFYRYLAGIPAKAEPPAAR